MDSKVVLMMDRRYIEASVGETILKRRAATTSHPHPLPPRRARTRRRLPSVPG